MRVRSYAKINWSLRVTGKRADGFHDLETLFQTISLHDEMRIERAGRTGLTCSDPTIPTDESNLILRAAAALNVPPVAIHLDKHVPSGGGLGGGSSNAAATLIALDTMFDLRKSPARMQEIALSLGSDVPFFLVGGTAYATGRGEVLTQLPPLAGVPLLMILPEERVATPEAFRAIRSYSPPIGIDRFRRLCELGLSAEQGELVNDFEESVFERLPHLGELKMRLYDSGAIWAGMSGSGSTIVGAFATEEARDRAAATFRDVRVQSSSTRSSAVVISEA